MALLRPLREGAAAALINAKRPGDSLLLIPKKRCKNIKHISLPQEEILKAV
jgi:hypothetical protein